MSDDICVLAYLIVNRILGLVLLVQTPFIDRDLDLDLIVFIHEL